MLCYSKFHLSILKQLFCFCLFVCLQFFIALENFPIITGEGLLILTHARHLGPLSSEVSFLVATPTVTRDINGLLRGHVTLTPFAERLAVELSVSVSNYVGLSRLGFEHSTFRLRGERSNRLHHRRGLWAVEWPEE